MPFLMVLNHVAAAQRRVTEHFLGNSSSELDQIATGSKLSNQEKVSSVSCCSPESHVNEFNTD